MFIPKSLELFEVEAPSTRMRRLLYPQIFFYADTKISASTRSVYESYTTTVYEKYKDIVKAVIMVISRLLKNKR